MAKQNGSTYIVTLEFTAPDNRLSSEEFGKLVEKATNLASNGSKLRSKLLAVTNFDNLDAYSPHVPDLTERARKTYQDILKGNLKSIFG